MIPALITGMGRSGSMWLAHALKSCCGLDARHESVHRRHPDPWQHVEVNTFLAWHPGGNKAWLPLTFHLVRDGRDCIRSCIPRHPYRAFDYWVWEWTGRNESLLAKVPDERRVRLEDLISTPEPLARICGMLGGTFNEAAWESQRHKKRNETPSGLPAPFDEWPQPRKDLFWRVCGPTMERLGYK